MFGVPVTNDRCVYQSVTEQKRCLLVMYNINLYVSSTILNIRMMSHERHVVSNYRSFDYLFNSLCEPIPTKHHNPHYWSFVTGIHRWPVHSLQRTSNAEKASIWWRHHDMAWYRKNIGNNETPKEFESNTANFASSYACWWSSRKGHQDMWRASFIPIYWGDTWASRLKISLARNTRYNLLIQVAFVVSG